MIEDRQNRVVHCDDAAYHGGPRKSAVDTIVIHSTMGHGAAEARAWDNRPNNPNPASYHYIVDRDGAIYRTVPPNVVAWHAGESALPPVPARPIPEALWINHRSLGIAFAGDINDDSNGWLFASDEQMVSAYWLTAWACATFNVSPARVLGHREVAPGRKFDPRPGYLVMPWFRWAIGQLPLLDRATLLQRYGGRHIWTSANVQG